MIRKLIKKKEKREMILLENPVMAHNKLTKI